MPLGSLPIALGCLPTGQVVLTPMQKFKTIIERSERFEGIFDMEGFTISSKEGKEQDYSYSYPLDYKSDELLLGFLQSLKLELPQFF